MTQEEKQLLLKDLCARLPYGIIASVRGSDEEFQYFHIVGVKNGKVWVENDMLRVNNFDDVEVVKPYLRPMSSMTEEEKEEFRKLSDEVVGSYGPYHREFIAHCVRLGIKPDNPHECIDDCLNMEAIDWLNAHHFDYRGLISMGLAIEAPEGMYNLN